MFAVRPKAAAAGRCSRCRRRCPGYDGGDGMRRWRTLDVGTTKAYLQAAAPRVQCREHGVVVAHVPWARPGAKHTHLFEDTCAWLAAHAALSVLTVLLRVAWRTVAAIVTRVVADGRDTNDLLAGLTRIGIDEIAYRKGHRYLTVIVDHDDRPAGVGAGGPQPGDSGRVLRRVGCRTGAGDSPTSARTARNGSTPWCGNGHRRR